MAPIDRPPSAPRRAVGGFLAAGAIGFAVDLGLTALLAGLGLGPIAARAPAMAAALFVTWRLNRRIAFAPAADGLLAEFGRYLLVSAAGAGLNGLVYLLVAAASPARGALAAAIAVVAGSAAAMTFNFLGYRNFAFAPAPPRARR